MSGRSVRGLSFPPFDYYKASSWFLVGTLNFFYNIFIPLGDDVWHSPFLPLFGLRCGTGGCGYEGSDDSQTIFSFPSYPSVLYRLPIPTYPLSSPILTYYLFVCGCCVNGRRYLTYLIRFPCLILCIVLYY